MKKILSLLFLLLVIAFGTKSAEAMNYEEAVKQSKPMALLIYADWADDVSVVKQNFDVMDSKYSKTYNFVTLNIASPQMKSYNKKYQIYQNLPYVILYRDGGKISRFLPKTCARDTACFSQKLDFFVN